MIDFKNKILDKNAPQIAAIAKNKKFSVEKISAEKFQFSKKNDASKNKIPPTKLRQKTSEIGENLRTIFFWKKFPNGAKIAESKIAASAAPAENLKFWKRIPSAPKKINVPPTTRWKFIFSENEKNKKVKKISVNPKMATGPAEFFDSAKKMSPWQKKIIIKIAVKKFPASRPEKFWYEFFLKSKIKKGNVKNAAAKKTTAATKIGGKFLAAAREKT